MNNFSEVNSVDIYIMHAILNNYNILKKVFKC